MRSRTPARTPASLIVRPGGLAVARVRTGHRRPENRRSVQGRLGRFCGIKERTHALCGPFFPGDDRLVRKARPVRSRSSNPLRASRANTVITVVYARSWPCGRAKRTSAGERGVSALHSTSRMSDSREPNPRVNSEAVHCRLFRGLRRASRAGYLALETGDAGCGRSRRGTPRSVPAECLLVEQAG